MNRTIKAKDILPGMTIRWAYGGVSFQCTISRVELFNGGQDVQGETPQGQTVLILGGKDVLVVKEPVQPEEPTWFGARVVVDGDEHYVRTGNGSYPWGRDDGCLFTWAEVCEMGPVTVIPDQGWKVPAETELTPEVPERIEEWPKDDEHLRVHKWQDQDRDILSWVPASARWDCFDVSGNYVGSYDRPQIRGPWTRVTDA